MISLEYIHGNAEAVIYGIFKTLAESPSIFFAKICKILMACFNGICGEENMVRHSSLCKWKSWQGSISHRLRDLRIGPKRYFQFQKNCKQL